MCECWRAEGRIDTEIKEERATQLGHMLDDALRAPTQAYRHKMDALLLLVQVRTRTYHAARAQSKRHHVHNRGGAMSFYNSIRCSKANLPTPPSTICTSQKEATAL